MNPHDMAVNDINDMLNNAGPPLSAVDCCIYKVPFHTRELNEDAYTPKVISIGPFHHRHDHHPHLQNMERHKLIFFKSFLQRTNTTLKPLIQYIDSIIPTFRRCYSETLDFTNQELVKLILIDSVFIIELFCKSVFGDSSQDEAFLLKPWLLLRIELDLLLLENQLPFFVLEKIFNISCSAYTISFLDLTFCYFEDYNISDLVYDNSVSIRHFTDLIRIFHLPQMGRTNQSAKHIRSVTELFEAGVRFKVNSESKCLLDLRFSGGVLEIPQLTVQDSTEIVFRNLVALEQCLYHETSYITDYVAILDFLINSVRDVDILVQKGILANGIGDSDSVAKMINGLCKNVTYTSFSSDYFALCEELNRFCSDPWRESKATLRRDYCSTPWKTAASVAGVLLLILSLLQSVCSVLPLVQQ